MQSGIRANGRNPVTLDNRRFLQQTGVFRNLRFYIRDNEVVRSVNLTDTVFDSTQLISLIRA